MFIVVDMVEFHRQRAFCVLKMVSTDRKTDSILEANSMVSVQLRFEEINQLTPADCCMMTTDTHRTLDKKGVPGDGRDQQHKSLSESLVAVQSPPDDNFPVGESLFCVRSTLFLSANLRNLPVSHESRSRSSSK